MDSSALPANGLKYRAFISYSRHDRRAAEWLQRSIESYRVPKPLVGTPGRDGPIPGELFPLFRDRADLNTSPDLSASIREALEQSAYLIVLCSPSAAKSFWVNQEISAFQQLGRSDRVHALIVDGDPSVDAGDRQCFPPSLCAAPPTDGGLPGQRIEPLAADLRPEGDGKDDARLKLIAGIIGISFNSLRKREALVVRQRLRLAQAIAGSMITLLLTAVVIFGFWLKSHRESDERQIPALRVEKHFTELNLNYTDRKSAPGRSAAKSTDTYTIIKTRESADNFVHIVGTSSSIPPDITCQTPCKQEPLAHKRDSRTRHETKLEFDISNRAVNDEIAIKYDIVYWNAFETADQLWAGVRIAYQTDDVEFTIIFPDGKHPPSETIRYAYFDVAERPDTEDAPALFSLDRNGLVASLLWKIKKPDTDRSYRVKWNWTRTTNPRGEAKP